MTNYIRQIQILLGVAILLSFALAGFMTYNFENPEPVTETGPIIFPTEEVLNPAAAAGKTVFLANCKQCHRIETELIGPPLQHVYSNRDSLWLRKWISNSSGMIASGDPDAVEVFQKYKQLQMTNFSTMKKEDMDNLLSYLKHVDKP